MKFKTGKWNRIFFYGKEKKLNVSTSNRNRDKQSALDNKHFANDLPTHAETHNFSFNKIAKCERHAIETLMYSPLVN